LRVAAGVSTTPSLRAIPPRGGGEFILSGALKKLVKFLSRKLAVAKDLGKESGTDSLACVNGHNRGPPIAMSKKMVAAFHPRHFKPGLPECGNQFLAANAG